MSPCAHCELMEHDEPHLDKLDRISPRRSTRYQTALLGKLDVYGTAGASGIHVSKETGPAE